MSEEFKKTRYATMSSGTTSDRTRFKDKVDGMDSGDMAAAIHDSAQSIADALFGLYGLTFHQISTEDGANSFNPATVRCYITGLGKMFEAHMQMTNTVLEKIEAIRTKESVEFAKSVEKLTEEYEGTRVEFEKLRERTWALSRRVRFCKKLIKAVQEQEGPVGKPKKKGPKKRIEVLAEELSRKMPKDQYVNLSSIMGPGEDEPIQEMKSMLDNGL